ncbi:MAG: dihydroorotase [Firmicutes bacterium]|nr:dihydroorotase [Bacillota bacterium]
MTILLKYGRVIDYRNKLDKCLDILITDDKISQIGENIDYKADKIIDCTNLYVVPGLIDMHCHLREPGFTHKETIETGSKSAVCGGFTTICPMPNTKPATDSAFILEEVIKKAGDAGLCNVLPYGAVTIGEQGEELTNFEELKKAGAAAFSDDGIPVKNAAIMREAIIKADKMGTFVSSHCEETSVSAGAINYGRVAEKLGVKGVLPEAEVLMAARETEIAEINNVHVHICHISCKETVNLIRDAKKRGVKVTAETCPHYYSLTEEDVLECGANAKMNPPLRTKEDREAIIEAIKDGTVDSIITDHAPHTEEEKQQELSKAPNGIIGFETALPVTITYLVHKGHISYMDMVKLMSYNPAKILGIDKGVVDIGKIADITVFDPDAEYVYKKEDIVSKSKNSPYIGKKLKGKVRYTIVGGGLVYELN